MDAVGAVVIELERWLAASGGAPVHVGLGLAGCDGGGIPVHVGTHGSGTRRAGGTRAVASAASAANGGGGAAIGNVGG